MWLSSAWRGLKAEEPRHVAGSVRPNPRLGAARAALARGRRRLPEGLGTPLVRELQLEGKVRFLGQRADVPQILGAADVFVLSSQNEGNPLALMEAMASGLPVVATAVGGVPELIVDQKSGLLAMPDDCEGLASSMLRLFRDADMRRTMGGAPLEQALQSFSAARMAHTHMELYERILAGRASIDEDCRIEMAAHYPN